MNDAEFNNSIERRNDLRIPVHFFTSVQHLTR